MSAMEAVVGKVNLKIFTKALVCLSKVGSEVVVETLSDRIVLRALSQSESAFGHFSFAKVFFDSFRHLVNGVEKPLSGEDAAIFKCKVNSKAMLTAFRGIPNCDRLVFGLDAQNSLLIFQLATTRTGIQRTYQFTYQDQTDILQAEFSRSTCPNIISANAKFLNRYMSAFTNDGEITLVATHNGLKVFNFVEDSDAHGHQGYSKSELDQQLRASLQTQYLIDARDFERFNVLDEYIGSEITFCLRELKAILSFCEATDHALHIFFHAGGMPILLTTSHDGKAMFAADIVVATLQNENQIHHPANSKDERWPSQQRGTPSQSGSQPSFGQDNFRPPSQPSNSQHFSQPPSQHSSQSNFSQHPQQQQQQQQQSQHSSQGNPQFSQPRPPQNQFNNRPLASSSSSYQSASAPQYSHPSNQQPFTRPPAFHLSSSSVGGVGACSSSSSSGSSNGSNGCNNSHMRSGPSGQHFDSQSTRSLAGSHQPHAAAAPQTYLQKQAQQKQQAFLAQHTSQQPLQQQQQLPQSQSSQSPTQQQSQTQVQSQQQISQFSKHQPQQQTYQQQQHTSQLPQSYQHPSASHTSQHPFPLSSHLPYQASRPFQPPTHPQHEFKQPLQQQQQQSQASIRLHFEMSPPRQELRHISPIHPPNHQSQNSFNSQDTLPSNISFDLEPGFAPPSHISTRSTGTSMSSMVAPTIVSVHLQAGQRAESRSQERRATGAQMAFLRGGLDEESVENDEGDYVPGTPQLVPPQELTRQHATFF